MESLKGIGWQFLLVVITDDVHDGKVFGQETRPQLKKALRR